MSELLAFERLEPMSDSWLEAGIVAATIANVMGSPKKRLQPTDFMPGRKPKKRDQSPDEGMAILRAMMGRQKEQH